MSETVKSYRIKANAGQDSNLNINLNQNYNVLEILSLKINEEDLYKIHSANYGVIVGRVLANNGFGVPNAKVSVFIEGEFSSVEETALYPYSSVADKDSSGIRYNLLVDKKVDDCHQVVGTFPNKTYLLDNDDLIEIFDKYYKYTTRTNNSGDYLICGVPTGNHTLHMDLDLSDCGILSQRPRDFVYKGYTIEQFENPNQFKIDTELNALSQIFSQDQTVDVIPFWGESNNGENIGITRADINVSFKFEPTCVFMGSLVADNASNGISKKCVPTNQMGAMNELTTGEGTIEMIRKTMSDDVEEFQIKGTQLIDGNGVWCYQIPMNLDYMATDEYGNLVPTDDPERGIPTRARVRFRISMQDFEGNTDNYFRAKVLVPHNPQDTENGHEDYDYEFGTQTKDESFRDLFWNNVYTVKSYIPRIQKSQLTKTERFSGIKHCNIYGNNNPMPYNNIRIRLPLMFTLLCALIKTYIRVVRWINTILDKLMTALGKISNLGGLLGIGEKIVFMIRDSSFITLADGLCPDLDNWYFSPSNSNNDIVYDWGSDKTTTTMLYQTFKKLSNEKDGNADETSVDYQNSETSNNICLTTSTDYLISCIEMNLAQEYKVINFDFYNDWVNGVIYMPRWMRQVTKKHTYLFGLIKIKSKVKACMDDSNIFGKTRRYVQQCSLAYKRNEGQPYSEILTEVGCTNTNTQKCHKAQGMTIYTIFGSGNRYKKGNGGAVHSTKTSKDQYVYYFKPCEWSIINDKKTILFANDIVLLGSLNECNLYGIPQAFKHLTGSSYIMPTNLALTNMDDDGYVYSDNTGTICSRTTFDRNLTLSQVPTSFSAESQYYSNTQDENIKYGTDEEGNSVYDDTIPLTEAAGIAWNYTGPGQGRPSDNSELRKRLYLPGGHFLGISCINSETNIKSCINLQRICEVGSSMSQRREVVREVINNNGDVELKYRYFVPTGLISQEEIVDGDFRTMFSTMNHKRLLCTDKTDKQTGYPIYDFIYLRSNGFDGKLKKSVDGVSEYNTRVNTDDEYAWLSTQGNLKGDDYDINEAGETYTKTLENVNNDYYMFRMGLNGLSTVEQDKRFLFTNNGAILAQYENSYYFYFGLKNGATALDEFNKQFFSTCESDDSLAQEPSLVVTTSISDDCLIGDISVYGRFTTSPMEVILRTDKGVLVESATTVSDFYEFTNIKFGNYTVEVIDSNEITLTKDVILGIDKIKADYSTIDFSFRTKGMTYETITTNARVSNSGLFNINKNIAIGNTVYTIDNNTAIMLINTAVKDDKYIEYMHYPTNAVLDFDEKSWLYDVDGTKKYNAIDVTARINGIMEINNEISIPIWRSSNNYALYVYRKCEGVWKYVQSNSFAINGVDSYDLYLGSKLLPYSDKLSTLNGEWWNTIGDDSVGIDNWAKRHALFRQTDDDNEYFENKVYTLDSNDREISTVLFGQPETFVGGNYVPYSKDGKTVWYENDTEFEGNLSNESIIPTWPSSVSQNREHFSEMGCYNSLVVSNTVGPNVIVGSGIGRANSKTINLQTQNTIAIGDGCIIKMSDNTLIYPVKIGELTYEYYGDDYVIGSVVDVYPTFKFPIMYRPFYGKMDFFVWNKSALEGDIDSYEKTDFVEVYGDAWRVESEIHNGITYKNKFNNIKINRLTAITGTQLTDIIKRNGSTDVTENSVINTIITRDGVDDSLGGTVGFSIEEGIPESIKDTASEDYVKINKPRIFKTASIEGSADYSNMEDNDVIWYYYDAVNNLYSFSGSSNNDYYLFNYATKTTDQPLLSKNLVAKYKQESNIMHYIVFQGKFNEIAYTIDARNKVNGTLICYFDAILTGGLTIKFSMYDGTGEEEILYNVSGLKSGGMYLGGTCWQYICEFKYDWLDRGSIGYRTNITIADYLKECGIDISTTYTFDTTNKLWGKYLLDQELSKAKKIKLGTEYSYGGISIGNDTFCLCYNSNTSGKKGEVRVIKIYPKLKEIEAWTPGTPSLRLNPNGYNYFGVTGGDVTVTLSSNIMWSAVFTNVDGSTDGYEWLSAVTEDGSVELIRDGKIINGTGTISYTFKCIDNSGYDGREGFDISAHGKTKGYAIKMFVYSVDDPTLNQTLIFVLDGKKNKMYIKVA